MWWMHSELVSQHISGLEDLWLHLIGITIMRGENLYQHLKSCFVDLHNMSCEKHYTNNKLTEYLFPRVS